MTRSGSRLNVVLVEPEIPPNTGNVARLCAVTQTKLHLIEPLGFDLDDRRLKRAGMDYWQHVDWQKWPDWTAFTGTLTSEAKLWFVESSGPTCYSYARFSTGDYLVFGRESAGLPEQLCLEAGGRVLRIPMFHEKARSLNLSNCVALVLYEAIRQLGFDGEV